jgi:hypothetical protein
MNLPNDPAPENQLNDRYHKDEVSSDYSADGYFLYDLSHPGIGIVINVDDY